VVRVWAAISSTRAPAKLRENACVLGREIEGYLDEILVGLRDVIGDRLVGAWLFGSGAIGDFDPARSDLDVQVVTTVRLARSERKELVARLSHPALACPVRGLELVVYAREDLSDPLGPAFQLNLNTGPRMDQHVAYDLRDDPRFWFVIDVAIGRAVGRVLAGPPPAEVFPELPAPLVSASLSESLAWFAANDPAGGQAALAAARALAWAEEGRWLAKRPAALWLAARVSAELDARA
jgi:predicted nucleotidyltransferase